MTQEICVTILGCGSSGGVPRLGPEGQGPNWGLCDASEPKNRRRRCSLLVEKINSTIGTTRVLIDTSPDLHAQLLDANVGVLDAVVYTHAHADHTNGLDDLRQVVFNLGHRLPVWADAVTARSLRQRFHYAFDEVPNSGYRPILDLHILGDDAPLRICGAGGEISLTPFRCGHGEIDALGFRIGDLAYLPDAVSIPHAHWPLLSGLRMWIVDALQRHPHPTHAHLGMALEWIARATPEQAILTNMHIDMDYATLCAELPPHIRPAYDGMQFRLAL